MAQRIRNALLGIVALGLPAVAHAETDRGGVFVLPVEPSWPITQSAASVFEERLSIALSEGKHLRVVSQRDLPAAKRATLPKELSTCTASDCVKKLAEIAGVDRVIGLRIADDQGRAIVFSVLYEGASGAASKRKEWKADVREPQLPPSLAKAIAGWIVGEPPPAPPAPPKVEVLQPGLLGVELGANQTASPEARALLTELTARLHGYGDFAVGQSGGKAELTHRASVVVDHIHITTRQHHVHHYFDGALAATVVITDLGTQTVIFTSKGQSSVSTKTEHTSETAVLATMVTAVVDQWMSAFASQGVSHNLKRKAKP